MDEPLAVGDIVTVKSGSPQMTIEELSNDKEAQCVWMDSDGASGWKVQRAAFALAVLIKTK